MHMSRSGSRASTPTPADPDVSRFALWVEAARPKTITASVVPVLVGTAVASNFHPWRALAAMVVSLGMQIAVNFANDYFDAVKGVDSPDRVGPRRLTAAGLISPGAMKRATAIALGAAIAAGLWLSVVVGYELLILGVLCVAAALAYSGGPRPYASWGGGELFVFAFFGVVATAGSGYVQDETLSLLSLAASVPIGLLAAAILEVNNLRDISTDAAAGKRTLAVRLGAKKTRALFLVLVVGALVSIPVVAFAKGSWMPLLALAAAPLAAKACITVMTRQGAVLNPALGETSRSLLLVGLVLAATT